MTKKVSSHWQPKDNFRRFLETIQQWLRFSGLRNIDEELLVLNWSKARKHFCSNLNPNPNPNLYLYLLTLPPNY